MSSSIRRCLLFASGAFVLTVLFWWPLYTGAGFVGGDLYPYFFPQKAFYADSLKAGIFPLWNDLTGFGYPVFGESQTGAAYPFHLVLYRCFELNTAYNIEHLLHYIICFVGTGLFAHRLGLTGFGAGLSALVFTYGWFPPRSCLEWAILTGAWLPVALWCVESFLQDRQWRYAIGLSVTIGVQLLAGHYHLAFITQLLVATYTGFRLWRGCQPCRTRAGWGLGAAVIAGVLLASIQLLPTWELKQRSSRVVSGSDYDPAHGHMPPLYATQAIAPWLWYSQAAIHEDNFVRDVAEFAAPWHWFGPLVESGDQNQPYFLEKAIQRSRFAALSTATNPIEAHFYCGLAPVALALFGMIFWFQHRPSHEIEVEKQSMIQITTGYWLVAGVFALVYATGWLLPIGRHVPGFSFFRGPGRYGIVTTLAVALLAGHRLDRLAASISSRFLRILLLAAIYSSTWGDLWLVSRMVTNTIMVSRPFISFRSASPVRQLLLAEPGLPRLLAPGANVGNLLGVSCVPWYLGIAPAEYVDPQFAMPPIPKPRSSNAPTPATPELIEWLSRSGVTHILNFEPLEEASWQAELVWKGLDPLLNLVWARQEPIHLYRLRPGVSESDPGRFPGRAYLMDSRGHLQTVDTQSGTINLRRISVKSDHDEKTTLILTELAYPGWTVQMNSIPLEGKSVGLFKAVEISPGNGEVTWTYQPRSVCYGAGISLVTLVMLALIAHIRFWHPQLIERVLGKPRSP